ncbi:MAG: 16S rRNA (adenine(1518)-N(6)/adenine(1519)-N(6))-dimethyltransferase RsmA [Candidatus Omnitrophica bacterium]|nr:16S rRNA (adenine(1518)-N(6)/adenine(1519)-N(6))-dimethyltransferase RsmA [Candidatus Omnitrophota bacterium]MDD5671552.1 16S rRNA (adenine(1518)-N(6)/adenine(1519)-N(6))-dimethyltransferase RsmA [Candidatus Omnitrophota bacterium]
MSTQIELLKKYGLSVRGYLGQHILIDPNIQKKIVDALDPGPKDLVLEIGPGLGALTEQILKRGSKVWAVEKDPRFAEILKGELGPAYKQQLQVIHNDILDVKLERLLPRKQKASWKVISNLPYYITAPILLHVLSYRKIVTHAIFTMQKEVANRLKATPGTKDYGRLSLAVRYAADVHYLFDIPPTCFAPPPEVNSSAVELVFHTGSQMPEEIDEGFLFYLIQLAFSARRKTLLHHLCHDPKIRRDRRELLDVLKKLGLPEKVRGEDLLLKDFFALASELEQAVQK